MYSYMYSGVNLTSVGAWEDSRKAASSTTTPDPSIEDNQEETKTAEDFEKVEEITLTDMEISRFENGDEDVFEENSSDSFVEIPSDAE